MKQVAYIEIRNKIHVGDIFAFSGRGFISWVVKTKTRSPVSHVGIVLQVTPEKNYLIESTTTENNKSGVFISNLSNRIKNYDGEIWWLKLSKESRNKLNEKAMHDFLLKQNHKSYDSLQAIFSAIIVWTKENLDKIFCSELCGLGLEIGGVIEDTNCSEMTPKDIVDLDIYDDIVQLHGKPKEIF